MAVPTRILVPIDLSARSLLGLDYAATLAKVADAELLLFCNINLPERVALEEFGKTEDTDIEQAARQQLEHSAADRAPGTSVTVLIGFDDSPAHGILTSATEHEVDLIVVASHGRSGMTRWLLGSVAEKIARSADVPVVIVPARSRET